MAVQPGVGPGPDGDDGGSTLPGTWAAWGQVDRSRGHGAVWGCWGLRVKDRGLPANHCVQQGRHGLRWPRITLLCSSAQCTCNTVWGSWMLKCQGVRTPFPLNKGLNWTLFQEARSLRWPGGDLNLQMSKDMKIAFWETAQQGIAEKSSFVWGSVTLL